MVSSTAPGRRAVLAGIAGSVATTLLGGAACLRRASADERFFRIGTGSIAGTYFPIGSIICDALNEDPPGAPCAESPCALRGRQAVAELSNGSISNFQSLRAGTTDAGLMQADVAYNGWKGTGFAAAQGPFDGVRFVASLFPESFHLAVRRDSDIRSFGDIVGHRIALDEPDSGTITVARALLAAYGIKETDLRAEYVKWEGTDERPDMGHLDGLMKVAGDPTAGVAILAAHNAIRLIPVIGPEVDAAIHQNPFMTAAVIPAGSYAGIPETPTVHVQSQLIASTALSDDLVYDLTRRLWSDETLARLRLGHPRGASITLATALVGVSIPFHPGAQRHYQEIGLIK